MSSNQRIVRYISILLIFLGLIYGLWLAGLFLYDDIMRGHLTQFDTPEFSDSELIRENEYSGSSGKSLVAEYCISEDYSKVREQVLGFFPDARIIRNTDTTILVAQKFTNLFVDIYSAFYGFGSPGIGLEAINGDQDGCQIRYYITYQWWHA